MLLGQLHFLSGLLKQVFVDARQFAGRSLQQAAKARFGSSSVSKAAARTSASSCSWTVRKKRSIRPPAGGSRGGRCSRRMFSAVQASVSALAW